MARKKLTPEDIKIHVDNICTFLENNKKHSEITKFNSRFPFLKNILINKKLIQCTIGKRNTIMYKHDKDFVLFPKDYEDILKEESESLPENYEVQLLRKAIGSKLPHIVKDILGDLNKL